MTTSYTADNYDEEAEIKELLFLNAAFDLTNRVCVMPKGKLCKIKSLCNECKKHSGTFWQGYHLKNNVDKWTAFIKNKFDKDYKKQQIDKIIKYSSIDIELYLREKYEKLYIDEIDKDERHKKWCEYLIRKRGTGHHERNNLNGYWSDLIKEIQK